jgi:hypothetical protein
MRNFFIILRLQKEVPWMVGITMLEVTALYFLLSFPTARLIIVSQHKVSFIMWLSLPTFIQTEWVHE